VDSAFALAIFVLGSIFGSFLNVCIYRLPRGLSVVHPRSACPGCNHPIAFYDNIPILSWLLLRGRCRRCATPITPRYMVVEILAGLMFLLCYMFFGISLEALKYCVFGFLLLGLIFTDAETQLLPDSLTLPGLVLGLIFSLFVPVNDLVSQLLPGAVSLPVSSTLSAPLFSLVDALLGAAVGASFIYGIGAVWFRVRGIDAMGFGDVKLMAMVGAFLGIRLTMFTMFAASIAGSMFGVATVAVVWAKRTRRRMRLHHEPARVASRSAVHSAQVVLSRFPIPFGVFLGSMAIVAFLFGHQFLAWYWRMM
jgi:leader peptidase (prepilin peptidase)/N-methyltransferase